MGTASAGSKARRVGILEAGEDVGESGHEEAGLVP